MGLLAHVGSGVFEPLQVIGVTAFGAAYALRAATLAREGRPVPPGGSPPTSPGSR